MGTRRDFIKTTSAATVGVTLAANFGRAVAAEPSDNVTQGEDIVRAKPALRERWSQGRSLRILSGGGAGPTWPEAEIITFVAEVDDSTARRWLPPPLEPSEPAKATFFITRYPMTKLGFGYNEAAVLLHATHEGSEYLHCTWMVVDDDTALILGRELLGFPKKIAEIQVDIRSQQPTGSVDRKGYRVLEVSGTAGQPIEGGAVFPKPIVNTIGLPLKPTELIEMGVEERFHSGKQVDLEVSVGQSDLDPLYRLEIQPTQKGMVLVDSFGAAGAAIPGRPQGGLSGTAVSPDWLAKAYPFRTW